MYKKVFFILLIVLGLVAPSAVIRAEYSTYIWGTDTILNFPGVAATEGGTPSIGINVLETSYLHYYALDIAKLTVEMYPGSKISLKSTDRKMFRTNIVTADTVCSDNYSSFSYSTPGTYASFVITFLDGDNCPAVKKIEPETTATSTVEEQIDVTNLDKITTSDLAKTLGQESKTNFVLGNIVETIDILSVGAARVKVGLSAPAKEFDLTVNKEKTVDTNADGWNDLSLILKSTDGGVADLIMKITEPVKVTGVNPGDLVKIANSKAVYYVGADSRLYIFPNDKVYFSWYADFDKVKTISETEMARFSLGGLITYRPGLKMVKFTVGNDVYVVARGGVLRKLKDEAMAKEFYGDDWNKKIDDINDAFYFSYAFGDNLVSANEYSKEAETVSSSSVGVDKGI